MEEDVAEQGQAPLSASDGADEMKRLKIFATIDSLLVKQITEWHNRALVRSLRLKQGPRLLSVLTIDFS
jgi:hypothetical protein